MTSPVVIDIDCTAVSRDSTHDHDDHDADRAMALFRRLSKRQPRSRQLVDVDMCMDDVWVGASHRVSHNGRREGTLIIRTPPGTPHGTEVAVSDTPLVLRFNRDDSAFIRYDVQDRYSVRIVGDDVVYVVTVSVAEARDGFKRRLCVVACHKHLNIRCHPGRALYPLDMCFANQGVARRGHTSVSLVVDSV